jgi:hypothetical protein
MSRIIRYRGYTIQRGDYLNTNDNRADRWYAERADSDVVDRRGQGYSTIQDAKRGVDEYLATIPNKRYDGYTISTGFLGGNLSNEGGLNLDASCSKYAEMLTTALEAEFPGAEINVDYQVNVSGSIPCTLETRVSIPTEAMPDDDLAQMEQERELIETVDNIASRVWESWGWAVKA